MTPRARHLAALAMALPLALGADTAPPEAALDALWPRGTSRAFRNTSPEPAVAYAVYAPPFDGTDRTIVD